MDRDQGAYSVAKLQRLKARAEAEASEALKQDPQTPGAEEVIVEVLSAEHVSDYRGVVVVVEIENLGSQPTSIKKVVLRSARQEYRAVRAPGFFVDGLDWLSPRDIRLDARSSTSGAWFFGRSLRDGGEQISWPLADSPHELQLEFLGGQSAVGALTIGPSSNERDAREWAEFDQLVAEANQSISGLEGLTGRELRVEWLADPTDGDQWVEDEQHGLAKGELLLASGTRAFVLNDKHTGVQRARNSLKVISEFLVHATPNFRVAYRVRFGREPEFAHLSFWTQHLTAVRDIPSP